MTPLDDACGGGIMTSLILIEGMLIYPAAG
jgi:hypothetical protein